MTVPLVTLTEVVSGDTVTDCSLSGPENRSSKRTRTPFGEVGVGHEAKKLRDVTLGKDGAETPEGAAEKNAMNRD